MFDAIVRNGILMTVAALIISVLGVLAAFRVPVQMIPDLEVRTVSIQTSWPGATPQDVEKEILIEQEEYLRTLPNMHNALNQVPSYPENVDEPRVFANSFSANSFMYFAISPLPGNPRNIDIVMMLDFVVDNVRTRLSGVAGVSQVNVSGGAERQIRILLDPTRLAVRIVNLPFSTCGTRSGRVTVTFPAAK
jgi:multidrug efflux pump subunit AcrB